MTDIGGWMKSVESRLRELDQRIRNSPGHRHPWTIANTKGCSFYSNYVARYHMVGSTVHCFFKGYVQSTTDGGPIAINLPVPAAAWYTRDVMVGTGMYHNPGIIRSPLLVGMGADGPAGDGMATFWYAMTNNAWLSTANTPNGIGMSGDEFITAEFTYEAAV